jgi:Helix-turn-helix domain
MKMTLGQAAKHSGFSKPTLSRAIKNGKLSASRLEDGSYAVDPAELERWMDSNGHRNTTLTRLATPDETPETPIDNRSLQVEVKMLREMLDNLNVERERERSQLSQQIDDLRRTAFLLADKSEKSAPAASNLTAEGPRRGWWPFLRRSA